MNLRKSLTTVALTLSLVASGGSLAAAAPTSASAVTSNIVASQSVTTAFSSSAVNIAAKASSKKMKTKSNLNMRKGAGTKHKKVMTLRKGVTVTVVGAKSGWSKVKYGKKTGWVSSKYLQSVKSTKTSKPKTSTKKAAPKKKAVVKKKSSKAMSIKSVNSYKAAQQYLKQQCPQVKIKQIAGGTSHYNPSTKTIAIAKAHTKSYRMNFVFAHELSHHYQWAGHYSKNTSQWNRDIRNKKIEKQADQMSYYLTGKVGQGVYNKKKATGKQLTAVKNMINKGKKAGC